MPIPNVGMSAKGESYVGTKSTRSQSATLETVSVACQLVGALDICFCPPGPGAERPAQASFFLLRIPHVPAYHRRRAAQP